MFRIKRVLVHVMPRTLCLLDGVELDKDETGVNGQSSEHTGSPSCRDIRTLCFFLWNHPMASGHSVVGKDILVS